MLETRLIQLDTATNMELWQEAYKSAEGFNLFFVESWYPNEKFSMGRGRSNLNECFLLNILIFPLQCFFRYPCLLL